MTVHGIQALAWAVLSTLDEESPLVWQHSLMLLLLKRVGDDAIADHADGRLQEVADEMIACYGPDPLPQ
jgi:hypothetical protein